jgi:pteridine reductase
VDGVARNRVMCPPMTMPPGLKGKLALVTGAARRVGRAIAVRLAEAGMDVAFTYHRSAEAAQTLVQEIEAMGRRCLSIRVDNAAPDAPAIIFGAVSAHFDRLHVLVNNASTFDPTPFGQITADAYDHNQAINARTPLMLIQHFAPMLAAGYDPADPSSPGRVVNFIDIHVMGQPLRHYLAYNASKAALLEITSSCALELAPRVTVNAIAPGVVEWAENYSAAERGDYMTRVPLARPGTPADAAAAVLFLADTGSYCTGQIIRLDGGRFLT